MKRKSLVAGMVVLEVLLAGAAAGQASPCPRAALAPLLKLVGEWNVDWETRVDGAMIKAQRTTAVLEPVAGGCGIIERVNGLLRGKNGGYTAMVVAPADDVLQLAYVDSEHGGLLLFDGKQLGDAFQFQWQHDWGDHVQNVRREYSAISPSSFVVETYMSNGSGRPALVQRARYRRRRVK